MARILHIDTSTDVCSVAVSDDGMVVFNRESRGGLNHAEHLGTFVDEALTASDEGGARLDAVAVSGGPGSYTGLRIGVSMAKGVCYGRGAAFIGIPTLELLCVPVLLEHDDMEDNALLCPMLDARRMEVYAAIYDRALRTVRPAGADIVDGDTYRQWLDRGPVYFFGNGAAKCAEAIGHANARFIEGVEPLAKWMSPLAEKRLARGETDDVAYFTPQYIKDYKAVKPKPLLQA